MDETKDRIASWLRGIEGVGCTRVEARHLVAGAEGGSVVATFEGTTIALDDIVARLDSDAEAVGGVQRYSLLAFRADTKAPRDRLSLRVDGGADGDVSASEPASLRGALSQQMRHNEALVRMLGTMCGSSLDAMSKQTKNLAEALENANADRVEMWGLLRQLATHDREKVVVDAELASKAKQEDLLRESLGLIVPGIVAKFLPSPAVKESALTKLVESLTPEQQETVFGVLTVDQRVALSAVLDDVIKKSEANHAPQNGAVPDVKG
ncbi:MAG: hypothetical protein M3O46_19910 [Myxococcota bacterium]|nr:hypothetical protein [Myxococcota bacterium]